MFKVESYDGAKLLRVELPMGKTQDQLIQMADNELSKIESKLHGNDVYINGRLTTGMALLLGHKLAHITKSVSIYDPKEATYFKAVWH